MYQLIRRRRHCGFTQRPLTSMCAHHSPCRSTNDGSFAALPPWCRGAVVPCGPAAGNWMNYHSGGINLHAVQRRATACTHLSCTHPPRGRVLSSLFTEGCLLLYLGMQRFCPHPFCGLLTQTYAYTLAARNCIAIYHISAAGPRLWNDLPPGPRRRDLPSTPSDSLWKLIYFGDRSA